VAYWHEGVYSGCPLNCRELSLIGFDLLALFESNWRGG
jgi:hypothetical protein